MTSTFLDEIFQKISMAWNDAERAAFQTASSTQNELDRQATSMGSNPDFAAKHRANTERLQHLLKKKKDDAHQVPPWVMNPEGMPDPSSARSTPRSRPRWEPRTGAPSAAEEANARAYDETQRKRWSGGGGYNYRPRSVWSDPGFLVPAAYLAASAGMAGYGAYQKHKAKKNKKQKDLAKKTVQTMPTPVVMRKAAQIDSVAFFDELEKMALAGRTIAHAAGGALIGAMTGVSGDGEESKVGDNALKGAVLGGVLGHLTKKAADQLPGGKADDKKPSDFAEKDLEEGAKHEREHTKEPAVAREIAMDHLTEDKKYYGKLKKIEKKAFQTSMYSGPLSHGPFKMESDVPPFRVPPLVQKKAAAPLTPAGRLTNAMMVGKQPRITKVPGPSIQQQAKPEGFGLKLPGAGKGTNTI